MNDVTPKRTPPPPIFFGGAEDPIVKITKDKFTWRGVEYDDPIPTETIWMAFSDYMAEVRKSVSPNPWSSRK